MSLTLQFVRIADTSGASAQAASLLDLAARLTPDERARMARLLREDDRARFVTVRSALREALGRELGVPPGSVALETDAHGRPRLAGGGPLDFNVSHAGRWGLLAYARDMQVGVDIERLDAVADPGPLWDVCLHAAEKDALVRLAAPSAGRNTGIPPLSPLSPLFHRLWCLKEAAFKALGTGLQDGLTLLRLDVAAISRVAADPGTDFDATRPPVVPSSAIAWQADDAGLARALQGLELRLLPAPPGYGAALAWLPRG
ncbi:MAG: 4'-phosphopantetheinyl transferase superfamily protein [Pandoraea sp.]|nr:4'-phosphopantetheinyl transferase superfamily protein [Pandoraea sp.]MDR3399458.1 4'-phosphopantetheinyl transferase superfamily protein [Pandoraea sp.]